MTLSYGIDIRLSRSSNSKNILAVRPKSLFANICTCLTSSALGGLAVPAVRHEHRSRENRLSSAYPAIGRYVQSLSLC